MADADTSELATWSAKLEEAHAALQGAKNALANDKLHRSNSLTARLKDWLTTTPAEAAAIAAEERLSATTGLAKSAARQWVMRTARMMLKANEREAARHEDQAQQECRARLRDVQVSRWLRLAREARNQLSAAQDACESASGTELLDAVTTNKAISLLSSASTSDAAEAVRAANRAVHALVTDLPKRVDPERHEEPDDTLDLVVDFVLDFDLDVLSWLNASQLDDLAQQCSKAADKLKPLLQRLEETAAKTRARAELELKALRAVEAPFLGHAASLVPEKLRIPTPEGLSQSTIQLRLCLITILPKDDHDRQGAGRRQTVALLAGRT